MIIHLPAGAVPSPLIMYATSDRDETTPADASLSGLGDGKWIADVEGFTGRFWPTVEYTIGTDPHRVDLPYVDLPEAPDLVVSPEYVASKARPKIPLPLTEDQRETITDAILDAQADVAAYLGRDALVPTLFTESGRYDNGSGQWNLTTEEEVVEIVDVTPDTLYGSPTGTFTITYRAGIDAKNDPTMRPIRRYVAAAALNAPEVVAMWREITKVKGDIKSVTTEGQSITYDKATLGGGGKDQPGEPPKKSSLDRWRLAGRRVFQRRTITPPPWPYSSMTRGGRYL